MTDAQVGSAKWMAPEVMDPDQKSDGYAADRYAMGVRLGCDLFSRFAIRSRSHLRVQHNFRSLLGRLSRSKNYIQR